MDGANLPIFFGARSIGPPAGEPLDVPKGGGDGGRRARGGDGGRGVVWAKSVPARKASGEERSEKSGGHGGRVFRAAAEAKRRNVQRRTARNVQRANESEHRDLSAADDLAQLLERGLLGFCVVVVTPGNDFEHLSSDIAFPFPDGIETAQRRSSFRGRPFRAPAASRPNSSRRHEAIVRCFRKHRSESARRRR